MSKAVKIAISLPADLLEALEKERQARNESRSQFFRQAVEHLLRQRRLQEAVKQYVQGYLADPESDEEVASVQQVSMAALHPEDWS
jgi:metal-responsive CopG/Arc/MetJ family transcriptional regulator